MAGDPVAGDVTEAGAPIEGSPVVPHVLVYELYSFGMVARGFENVVLGVAIMVSSAGARVVSSVVPVSGELSVEPPSVKADTGLVEELVV